MKISSVVFIFISQNPQINSLLKNITFYSHKFCKNSYSFNFKNIDSLDFENLFNFNFWNIFIFNFVSFYYFNFIPKNKNTFTIIYFFILFNEFIL